MTLVLTVMSRNYALMVGDTRLCVPNKLGEYEPIAVDAVKLEHTRCLLVCFAGLAVFENTPAIDWLVERFAKSTSNMDAALNAIACELDGLFNLPIYRPHILTVTIAGWVLDDSETLTPIVASITNQDPWTFAQLNKFTCTWKTLPAEGGWVPTGQLNPSRGLRLTKSLEKVLREPTTPDVLANLLLATLRDEAAHNVTVGPKARVAILPQSILTNAQENGEQDYIVWRSRGPYIVAEVPMEIELTAEDLKLQLLRPDQLDTSKATIVD